jgi:hypothetical protein
MVAAYEEAVEVFEEAFVSAMSVTRDTQRRKDEYRACSVVSGRFEARLKPDAEAMRHVEGQADEDDDEPVPLADDPVYGPRAASPPAASLDRDDRHASTTSSAFVDGQLRSKLKRAFELVFVPVGDNAKLLLPPKQGRNDEAAPGQSDVELAPGLPLKLTPAVRCPIHRRHFVSATRHHALAQRIGTDGTYACLFGDEADPAAAAYRDICRTELENELGCDPAAFYVCPEPTCNAAVCKNCMRFPNKYSELKSRLLSIQYQLRRMGALSIVGLIVVTLAQSLYLPAVRNAVAAVFCHVSLMCTFPDCYSPPTPSFLLLALASGLILLFIGVGFVAFLFGFVAGRKVTLVTSGIFEPEHLRFWGQGNIGEGAGGGGAPAGQPQDAGSAGMPGQVQSTGDLAAMDSTAAATTTTAAAELDDSLVDEARFPATTLEVLTCDIDDAQWQAILQRDESMFKGAYQQYEFRYMAVHGPLMVFKLLQLGVVLYAGEPNSLTQLAAAGLVEVAQLAVLVATNPFTDPWIDALSKAGAVHQVGQLGLMGLFRADVAEDPGRRGAAFAMIGLATAYFVLVVAVIVFVVVVPVATAWRRTKAREAAERAAAEQRFEDERKEIAGRDREEQVQREQEEKDDSADLELDDDSDDDDDDDDGDANGDAAAHVDGDADDGSDDSDSW